jgi:hypothetical protein
MGRSLSRESMLIKHVQSRAAGLRRPYVAAVRSFKLNIHFISARKAMFNGDGGQADASSRKRAHCDQQLQPHLHG